MSVTRCVTAGHEDRVALVGVCCVDCAHPSQIERALRVFREFAGFDPIIVEWEEGLRARGLIP
jgi:hypothetical protein